MPALVGYNSVQGRGESRGANVSLKQGCGNNLRELQFLKNFW